MEIRCKACGKLVSANDVNMQKLVGRCASCNRIFDVSDQLHGATTTPRRARVAMPQSIVLVEEGRGLLEPLDGVGSYRAPAPQVVHDFAIVRRWFQPQHIFMAFFCVAWDSFLIFWYSAALSNWVMLLVPLLHVAAGVFLTYSTLAGFLNRTTIAVTGHTLSVRHGPIPWRGNLEVGTDALEQIYCVPKVATRSKGASTTTYDVRVVLKNGLSMSLVSGLPEPEQALFIEQAIESRLGIVDAPIIGELSSNG